MLQAGAAIQALEDYNRRTGQYLRVRSNGFQSIVKMLTSAIGEISTAGQESVGRLRQIETKIATASQADDIRTLKEQLTVCLDEIRKEAERQKLSATSTVDRLRLDLDRTRTETTSDPVTGQPPRSEAVEYIADICASGQTAYVVAIVLDRLQTVNVSFGSEAGDQLLRYFAGSVLRSLQPGDHLFRWAGASLLAVAIRSSRMETVREEIAHLFGRKMDYTIRTATRSILMPVTARWAVFPLTKPPEQLIQKIDAFASLPA
jgi:GGDEF domain-containing protein